MSDTITRAVIQTEVGGNAETELARLKNMLYNIEGSGCDFTAGGPRTTKK